MLFSKMKVAELLDPASRTKKAALERHHLFREGYLAKQGITERRQVNQIGNYALVEWSDNIAIQDAAPSQSFPRYAARFTEDELAAMCYWHAQPEGWETLDDEQALEARRKALAQVIRDGFAVLKD